MQRARLTSTVMIAEWIVSLIPWGTLLASASLAIHARFLLGRWPVVYVDNPRSRLFDLHEIVVYIALLTMLFSPLVEVPLLIYALVRGANRRASYFRAAFYLAGWLFLVGACVWDFTGFVEWYLD